MGFGSRGCGREKQNIDAGGKGLLETPNVLLDRAWTCATEARRRRDPATTGSQRQIRRYRNQSCSHRLFLSEQVPPLGSGYHELPRVDPSVLEPTLHPVLLSLGSSKRLTQQRHEGTSSALRCHWGRQPRAPPPPSDPLPGFICSSAPLWRLASVPLYPPHQLRHTPISIGTVPCFVPTRGGWPPRPPRTALLQGQTNPGGGK